MIIILTKLLPLSLLTQLILGWSDSPHILITAIAQNRLQLLSPFAYVHFEELIESINSLVDNRSRTFI